jgi:23S rRNA (cytosine1962-C5)-methyltransferase
MSAASQPAGLVTLKPRKSAPFFGRHPWVLDASIARVEGQPADGSVVDLASDRGEWIARGIYNSHSRIHVRLYTFQADERLDDDFWKRRLDDAIALRTMLGYDDPADAARMVFSEADGMSGLIVDRYGAHLVVQVTALAMAVRLAALLPMLVVRLAPRGIVVRVDRAAATAEGITGLVQEGCAWGEPPPADLRIRQHGVVYQCDLQGGQKTGFYLDQRENRRAAAALIGTRRLLDVCCYTGGFGLAAAVRAGATEVVGIDSSRRAVDLARANAAINGVAHAQFQVADCFDALEQLARDHRRFGAVVLDPPRFAGSRRALESALAAYVRLNRLGVNLLEPGGILVTCSCSGHVTREDFLHVLAAVSQQTGREIQVLEARGASPDHPTRPTCPESEYLKCVMCRVG